MSGHGHVTPNADGSKARCGGPAICSVCSREYFRVHSPSRPYGPPPPPPPLLREVTTDVRKCARCNADHDGMVFRRMANPSEEDYPYWALCPNGGGPILLRLVQAE